MVRAKRQQKCVNNCINVKYNQRMIEINRWGVGKGGIMYNGENGEEKKTQNEEKRKEM